MILNLENFTEIKRGLSKKKIYRNCENKLNKIYIDFSNDKKEFLNFIEVYEILKKIDITIPLIYEVFWNKKIIVMEDFGDNTFDTILDKKNLFNLLKLAVDNLIIIQNSVTNNDLLKLKKYSYHNLKKEISEFVDFYIPYKNILDFQIDEFYNCWKIQFYRHKFKFNSFAHKDFEFINLIFINKNTKNYKCGIIDFQNSFQGFLGWDLFSVLENSRVDFSRKYNNELIKYFYDNVNPSMEFNIFCNQYYLLNLARQTRLLGRWAKLYNQNKNADYLEYINCTEKRITSCLSKIQNDKLKLIYKNTLIN